MDAHMAAGYPTVNGEEAGVRKRGAKPKYKFVTAEEAVAHRFLSASPGAAFIFAVELHSVGSSRHASTFCLCAVSGKAGDKNLLSFILHKGYTYIMPWLGVPRQGLPGVPCTVMLGRLHMRPICTCEAKGQGEV